MDHGNAGLLRLTGAGEMALLAIKRNGAFCRRKYAGQNVHQRRFACTVFADNRVNFTPLNIKADVIQRSSARKLLYNIINFANNFFTHNDLRTMHTPKGET